LPTDLPLNAEIHTLVLYGVCAVALATTVATRRRRGDPDPPLWAILEALWPFTLLALLESLSLNANGHLVAEWLLPCLANFAMVLCSRSDKAIRWARRGLVLAAVLLWLHGGWLLTNGYVTRPRALAPGRKMESAWFTPLTGLRRSTR
jgi:hypothetical protein